MSDTFERRIEAQPAFDRRDPDPKKNRGIHGVEFRFSLIGELAAVSFNLSTGWLLPGTLGLDMEDPLFSRIAYGKALHAFGTSDLHPMPMSMSFHSAEPTLGDWQRERGSTDCDLLHGGKCYGDITFTGADRPFFALIHGGTDGMWEQLATELTS